MYLGLDFGIFGLCVFLMDFEGKVLDSVEVGYENLYFYVGWLE